MAFQRLAHTAQGAARAHAGHEHIYLSVGVAPYLLACGAHMGGGIGGVLKLSQDHGALYLLSQLFGAGYGALHALGTGGQLQLGAVGAQQVAALYAHRLGHGKYHLVAAAAAHPGQSHTGVAAGGLNDGGAGLEASVPLGIFYHGERYAVFHTAAGVGVLQFHYHAGLLPLLFCGFQKRGVPDQVGKFFVNFHTVYIFMVEIACGWIRS